MLYTKAPSLGRMLYRERSINLRKLFYVFVKIYISHLKLFSFIYFVVVTFKSILKHKLVF